MVSLSGILCFVAAILFQCSSGSNLTSAYNQSSTAELGNETLSTLANMSKAYLTYDWLKYIGDEVLKLVDLLGILPHTLITKGLRFTYLLPSWRQSLAYIIELQEDANYVYTALFDRLLIGYYEPEDFEKEISIQSLVGTVFSVQKIRNDTVRIGNILVNTTHHIFIYRYCVIYVDTAVEPK